MTGTAALVQASANSKIGYQAYGAPAALWASRAPEVIISGPYETGKTLGALHKLNALMVKYPNARALMVRKTYTSLIQSAVVTYEQKVLAYPPSDVRCPIRKFGGERPEFYAYPNGSRIVLGGMDTQHRGRTLSAEYDFIYVNQAEELLEDDWQALTRACTGRAGNAPYTQIMGDCNPDVPEHWIQTRSRLLLLESRHEDNPVLFNQDTGQITEQGKKTMATLDAMTGVRKKRGRYGLWVGREGQVYEYDPAVHDIDADQLPAFVHRYRVIDFGFTNPFVCQWWGEDSDGRLYRYRELYMSGRTVDEHLPVIHRHSLGERYSAAAICDHDAEDRATLSNGTIDKETGEKIPGIANMPADKRVVLGIQKVQERLKVQGDGKPRLFFVRDCVIEIDQTLKDARRPTSTTAEFAGYVWPETKAARAADERPVKADDHGMDDTRYMVMHLDGGLYAEPAGETINVDTAVYKTARRGGLWDS